jgi:uncharacterized protein
MKVKIQSLQAGRNPFDFVVKDSGFDSPERQIDFREIAINSLVVKSDENIVVTNRIRASAHMECENCLCGYDGVFDDEYTIIYSSSRDTVEDDDEEVLRYLGKSTSEIDLTEGLNEALQLALPMRLLCRPDCRGLCSNCGANLNEQQCDCKKDTIDPRWEGLKKLIGK